MRRIVALVLVSLMPAVPAAAQFEGTVHMRMSGSGSAAAEGMTMRIAIKGDRQATIMAMPPSAGPMAGMEMRSIIDAKTNTMTTLMPMPPGMPAMPGMADAKGFKTVTDLTKMSVGAQSDSKVEIKKLGTTQKIAGFDCDDYEITSGTGSVTRSCITQSLGRFILPEAGGGMGMGRRGGAAPPPWAKAFGDRAAFPLKVWTTDGKIAMEVTSVEKGPVPDSLFEIPDGYMDMGAMMRGRGGI